MKMDKKREAPSDTAAASQTGDHIRAVALYRKHHTEI